MKMNKKIIVSTLALAMGAALAGSVSGTVAWFQYSTRAQAAYIGTSAHCSEALEIQAVKSGEFLDDAKWTTELSSSDIQDAVTGGTDLEPITSMAMGSTDKLPVIGGSNSDKDDPKFYKNPIYQFTDKEAWHKAVAANYVQFDLYFHVKDINGASSATYLSKNLYLTDLTIKSVNDNADIGLYKAIRVHFATNESTPSNNLFAYDDGESAAATVSTDVYGNLDLNNDGTFDKSIGYEWDTRSTLVYGDANAQQVAKNAAHKNSSNKVDVLADDSDPYAIVANNGLLGVVPATSGVFKVTVTIWIEGWQKLGEDVEAVEGVHYTQEEIAAAQEGDAAYGKTVNDWKVEPVEGKNAADWDAATYIGKKFQVGMRFAIPAHGDNE